MDSGKPFAGIVGFAVSSDETVDLMKPFAGKVVFGTSLAECVVFGLWIAVVEGTGTSGPGVLFSGSQAAVYWLRSFPLQWFLQALLQ